MGSVRAWLAVTAIALVFAAVGLGRIVGVLQPRLAVAIVAAHNERVSYVTIRSGSGIRRVSIEVADPWGHSILISDDCGIYSVGPNGIDEDGRGDDVVPTASELEVGRRLDVAPFGLISLAVVIAWCSVGPYSVTPRSSSLWIELRRALVLASVPTIAMVGVVLWLILGRILVRPSDFGELSGLRALFVIPPEVAIAIGYGLLCLLIALAWRLSRPLASTSSPNNLCGIQASGPLASKRGHNL